jgi:multiple sugar transport system ATP-binding protein
MNFATVTIRADDNVLYAETPDFRLPVPAAKSSALNAWRDRQVVLGARPEHLALAGTGSGPAMSASVEVIEQLGSEMILEVRIGGTAWTVARVDPAAPLSPGGRIGLIAQSEHLHFFDPAREVAIT